MMYKGVEIPLPRLEQLGSGYFCTPSGCYCAVGWVLKCCGVQLYPGQTTISGLGYLPPAFQIEATEELKYLDGRIRRACLNKDEGTVPAIIASAITLLERIDGELGKVGAV